MWQGSVAIANHVLFLGQVSLGLLCLRWGFAGSLLETRQRIGASTAPDEWQNPVNMRKSTYNLHFSTQSAPDLTPMTPNCFLDILRHSLTCYSFTVDEIRGLMVRALWTPISSSRPLTSS